MRILLQCGVLLNLALMGFLPIAEGQLQIRATGMGRTTGHIADLHLYNPGDQELQLSVEAFYIPGPGSYQGYVVPGGDGRLITVPPGQTLTVSLQGYCTDIHRKPVPFGVEMPPFNTWLTPETAGAAPQPGFDPPPGSGWQPVRESAGSPLELTYPGTDVPLPYLIDHNAHPAESAALIFEMINAITETVSQMYESGTVPPTPFAGNPEKEREALIQQTFWVATSLLNPSDEDYQQEDFTERTYEQYAQVTGTDITTAPVEVQKEVNTGVENFWASFVAVGVEAKVLTITETTDAPAMPTVECGCTYAALIGIRSSINGERVPSGSRLAMGRYRFEPVFIHDCPEECHVEIRGRWVVDFIPGDGSAVIQDVGHGPQMGFTVEKDGRLNVRFSGSVYCNGQPCPDDPAGIYPPSVMVSHPVLDCSCTHCDVAEPVRILDARTNEAFPGDSIPWYHDRLRTVPPVVQSDCPQDCDPRNFAQVSQEIDYRYGPSYLSHNYVPFEYRITGPGEVRLSVNYHCRCDGEICGRGQQERTYILYETNDCCDRLRRQNNGRVQFNFNGGQVRLSGNQMILSIPPAPAETFTFDFNLEAIFCNLADDQIFAYLNQYAAQQSSGGQTREYFRASDISLDHPTSLRDTPPFYALLFSKTINGREVAVSIVMDEESCVYDVQVLYQDQLYEHAGPPYWAPDQLYSMANQMGSSLDSRFWHRAASLLSHLLRAYEYGQSARYNNALYNFLQQLHAGAQRLLNATPTTIRTGSTHGAHQEHHSQP